MTGVENDRDTWYGSTRENNDRVLNKSRFVENCLVLTILSRMNEVVNEFEVAKCLESVLDALVEEVAVEESLLRPPGDGDVGQTMR